MPRRRRRSLPYYDPGVPIQTNPQAVDKSHPAGSPTHEVVEPAANDSGVAMSAWPTAGDALRTPLALVNNAGTLTGARSQPSHVKNRD